MWNEKKCAVLPVPKKICLVLGDNERIIKELRHRKPQYLNSISTTNANPYDYPLMNEQRHQNSSTTTSSCTRYNGSPRDKTSSTFRQSTGYKIQERNHRSSRETGRTTTTRRDDRTVASRTAEISGTAAISRKTGVKSRSVSNFGVMGRESEEHGVVGGPNKCYKTCGMQAWLGTPTWLPPIYRQHVTRYQARDYFVQQPVRNVSLNEVMFSRYLRIPKRRGEINR